MEEEDCSIRGGPGAKDKKGSSRDKIELSRTNPSERFSQLCPSSQSQHLSMTSLRDESIGQASPLPKAHQLATKSLMSEPLGDVLDEIKMDRVSQEWNLSRHQSLREQFVVYTLYIIGVTYRSGGF